MNHVNLTSPIKGLIRIGHLTLLPLTVEDLKAATTRTIFHWVGKFGSDGLPLRARVNGKPKTWKTRPNDCTVPWKHGLYEYGYITQSDLSSGLWFREADEITEVNHLITYLKAQLEDGNLPCGDDDAIADEIDFLTNYSHGL
jgi:hypothetical protein